MPEVKEQLITVWDNWKRYDQVEKALLPDDAIKDTRSGFYCIHDEQTLESYINYLHILMPFLNMSETSGEKKFKNLVSGPSYMCNLGFVPVTAMPSYWDADKVKDILAQFQNSKLRIQVYPRPYLGTRDTKYESKIVSALPDWWVSKLDIQEKTGMPMHKIGVKEVFTLCGVVIH